MTVVKRSRLEQFEVTFDEGLRVVRLPIGVADGRCWATFVWIGSVLHEARENRDAYRDQFERCRNAVTVETPTGPLHAGRSGGGPTNYLSFTLDFPQTAMSEIRLVYSDLGARVAEETIDLLPSGS